MNLKNTEIESAFPALERVIRDQKFKATITLRLVTVKNKLAEKSGEFSEARLKLFQELGEESENKTIKIKPENEKQFNTEINELLDVEVGVEIQPILFSAIKHIEITPADLESIMPILDMEEG